MTPAFIKGCNIFIFNFSFCCAVRIKSHNLSQWKIVDFVLSARARNICHCRWVIWFWGNCINFAGYGCAKFRARLRVTLFKRSRGCCAVRIKSHNLSQWRIVDFVLSARARNICHCRWVIWFWGNRINFAGYGCAKKFRARLRVTLFNRSRG